MRGSYRQDLGELPDNEDEHATVRVQPVGSAVYVDSPNWPLGRMVMCHMISESLDALHAMADRIGVARRHFQNKRIPHYDICKAKRKLAVKYGAIELGRYEFVDAMRRIRQAK